MRVLDLTMSTSHGEAFKHDKMVNTDMEMINEILITVY